MVIAIPNRHQETDEFAVEDDGAPPFLAENAYVYEILLKGSCCKWEAVVSSVGDYTDPASFAKVPVDRKLVVAIHYPTGIPARPEFDKVRLRVQSHHGDDFFSKPFDYAPVRE